MSANVVPIVHCSRIQELVIRASLALAQAGLDPTLERLAERLGVSTWLLSQFVEIRVIHGHADDEVAQ